MNASINCDKRYTKYKLEHLKVKRVELFLGLVGHINEIMDVLSDLLFVDPNLIDNNNEYGFCKFFFEYSPSSLSLSAFRHFLEAVLSHIGSRLFFF